MLLCGWLSRRVRGGKEGLRCGWPGPVQSMRFCAKPEAEERERDCVFLSPGPFAFLRPSGVCVCRLRWDEYTTV